MPIQEAEDSEKIETITEEWWDENPEAMLHELLDRRAPLLGLPCARCRAYYDAAVVSCPICGCKDRVSPQACKPIIHARARAA